MDEGLFKRHVEKFAKREQEKQSIISVVLEKTGIEFSSSEFSIDKKTIVLHVSSTKKAVFIQRGGKDILTEIGYNLSN